MSNYFHILQNMKCRKCGKVTLRKVSEPCPKCWRSNRGNQ